MFKWISWFSSNKELKKKTRDSCDQMEQALWEIKDIYDLETEEVNKVVVEKGKYAEKIRLRNKKQ